MAYAHSDKREIDALQFMANPAPDVQNREKLEGGKVAKTRATSSTLSTGTWGAEWDLNRHLFMADG